MIDTRKCLDSELEKFLNDESSQEPLFVKNLENVQGDERDVILFSICYAPDTDGKFYMNFGPLNRVGGERRLNVAVTRAKEHVIVFSSIYGNQIDLNRTTAEGARHLKEFLEYAEKNTKTQLGDGFKRAREDLFVHSVAEFIEKQGYKVVHYVGQSACRIDLAILDPNNPDAYLMGIECDGVGYKTQLTVRDRDNLRHSVLKGLGWSMYRVWIAEWWHDHENACQHLLQAIKDAELDCDKCKSVPEKPVSMDVPPVSEDFYAKMEPPTKTTLAHPYTVWSQPNKYAQEVFYDTRALSVIQGQLRSIIELESPICEKLLRERIIRHWGFARAGEKIQAQITRCLPRKCLTTSISGQDIYWAENMNPDNFFTYRVSTDQHVSARDIDEIPPEELANAMLDILKDLHSCPTEALFSETVKVFGFQKVTENAKNFLQYAMSWLNKSGRL